MKIIHWKSGNPPEGFELGEATTDFGVGRVAYKFRNPIMPYEQDLCGANGRILVATIHKGWAVILHSNGEYETLSHGKLFASYEVLNLLREVDKSGLQEDFKL